MRTKSFIAFCLFCASLFAEEGISQAGAYRIHSQYQWRTAIDSLNHFHFERSDQVLDVGCGDGRVTAVVSDRVPDGSVVGIDISKAMIDSANTLFAKSNLAFLQASVVDIPFNDRFDKAISFNALHWVLEQKEALRSIYDSLKRGGEILLLFPAYRPNNIGVLSKKMAESEKWRSHFPNYKQVRAYYTAEQYASLLREVGFQGVEVETSENTADFQDRGAFVAWIMPLINFVDHLPVSLQDEFIEELADQMLLIDSMTEGGKISIRMVQLKAQGVK